MEEKLVELYNRLNTLTVSGDKNIVELANCFILIQNMINENKAKISENKTDSNI